MQGGRGHRGRGRGHRLHREGGPRAARGLLLGEASTELVPMHALQARPDDDFILLRPLLLHPAAAQAEDDALTRAMLVIVSVSVSPSCLLKGCVQRVRMRTSEHGGRSNDHGDTGQ